jgi:hypothetical protein
MNTPNTSEFSNQFPPLRSKLFKTKEEALAYAHNHARQHRYGLTTRRSGEQGRKITLCCDRGSYQDGKKSKYVSPELRKRGRTTRQTECPYQVKIRYLKRESIWKVSESLAALHLGLEATRSSHNHDPSEHAAIHANNRRPTEAEKQEILRLDRGMTISVLTRPTGIMVLVLTVDKEE